MGSALERRGSDPTGRRAKGCRLGFQGSGMAKLTPMGAHHGEYCPVAFEVREQRPSVGLAEDVRG
jgi:hypothetical protein